MKKQFLYLMAAAASLTACSTNDVIGDAANGGNGDGIVTADDQQLISIGAAINAQPVQSTRATVGGVQDIEGADTFHSWNGESLYLFMLQKSTLKPATEGTTGDDDTGTQNIIWNTKYTAPKPTTTNDNKTAVPTGSLTRYDQQIKYYPLADAHKDAEGNTVYGFDFYGYYDGGAAQGEGNTQNSPQYYKSVTAGEDGTVTFTEATANAGDSVFLAVDYKIDGSHDLLAGKAEVGDKPDGSSLTEEDWKNIQKRAFSAYTSRRDVQPSIDFKHLLSRIQFNVIAGNQITVGDEKNASSQTTDKYHRAMKVTGVKIVDVPSTGKLVIASTDEDNYPSSSLIWNSDKATFAIKDAQNSEISATNSVELNGKYIDNNFKGTPTQIGDALMVKAGETAYTVEVTLEQWVCVKEESASTTTTTPTDESHKGWEKKTQTITGTISLPKGENEAATAFAAGTSYTVNITVYGYEKIDVTGNLIAWGKFDTEIDVDLDGDDNDWTAKE